MISQFSSMADVSVQAFFINYRRVGAFFIPAQPHNIVLRVDEFDQIKLERLRRELQLGIDQFDRGEGIPLNAGRINRAIERKLKKAT